MFIKVNEYNLEYSVIGKGSPVVVLHGWGCDYRTMQCLINPLSEEHTVYSMSFPGHGQSDKIKGVWEIYDYYKITKAFLDALNLNKIDIVCHSFGARVAILLCSAEPERVGKLVITGGAGIKPKRSAEYYFKVYSYKTMKYFYKVFKLDTGKLIQKRGSEDYKVLNENERITFSKVVNTDLTKYLKDIKASTLLIWGDKDTQTPLYMAKIMEKEIPDCGLVVLDGSHFVFLEKAADFNKIAKYFLGVN